MYWLLGFRGDLSPEEPLAVGKADLRGSPKYRLETKKGDMASPR